MKFLLQFCCMNLIAATWAEGGFVSLGPIFTEEFADQNHLFWKFSKTSKNGRFCMANIGRWIFFFTFFPPIFLAPLSCSFWTTKLWSGTQNEDFQQKLPSDKKLSFTDQGVHCTVSFTSWWYEFILSYNEHTVKYYDKSDAEEIPVWPQSWSLNQY